MEPMHLRNVPGGPDDRPMETFVHSDFFELLFSYIKPERYLELGVRTGSNFVRVAKYCKEAIAVDIIDPEFNLSSNMEYHKTTTDVYFENLFSDIMFDAVFIDADHSHSQSLRDFLNVKDRIITDGFIFFHDTYPYDSELFNPGLCNDVYKTALYIKQNFSNEFEILTLPFNPGVTILKKMPSNKQLIYID